MLTKEGIFVSSCLCCSKCTFKDASPKPSFDGEGYPKRPQGSIIAKKTKQPPKYDLAKTKSPYHTDESSRETVQDRSTKLEAKVNTNSLLSLIRFGNEVLEDRGLPRRGYAPHILNIVGRMYPRQILSKTPWEVMKVKSAKNDWRFFVVKRLFLTKFILLIMINL
jgi:hypothetical protein